MAEAKGWAVIGPDGDPISIAQSRTMAWMRAERGVGPDRETMKIAGYRCIPVTVTEGHKP